MTEPLSQDVPAAQAGSRKRSPLRVIARNTLFGTVAQFALRGLGFVFNIFVVNRLGDAGYGQYSVVLAWTGIFAFIGDMGIAQYLAREIARDREKSLALFWDVAALRLILAILAIAVTLLGAMISGYSRELVVAMAILTSSYFIQAFLAPLQSIIGGYERLDILSILVVVGQMLYYGIAILLLLVSPNFLWLVVASVVYLPVITAICAVTVIRRNMRPPAFKLTPTFWPSLLRFGLPFAFIQVSLTFAFRFDTLILESHDSTQVVGWYNAAYTLTRSLLILTSAFSVALVPTIAREHLLDPGATRPWYFRSVKFIALMGLPLAVGGTVLADKIILALYGPKFSMSILAFAILIWDTPLLMYTSICGNFATAMKIEKRAAWVYAAEAVFNILLNLLLIPRYGLLAASVVTVATELVGAVLFYRIFRRELGPGLGFTSMLRLAFSLAAMGAAVFLLRDWNALLLIPVGAAVYIAMIWITRTLTTEEQGFMLSSLRRLKTAVANRG